MKSKIFIFTTLILVVFLFVITSCNYFLNGNNNTTININLDLSKIVKTSRNVAASNSTEYILKVFAYNAASYKPEDEIENLPLLTQTENKVDINGKVKARLDVTIGLNVIFVAKLYQGEAEEPIYAGNSEVIKIKTTNNKVHLVLTRENAVPKGFVLVKGTTITGTESWTPKSEVFVSKRNLTIPDLIVSDHEVTRGEYLEVMGSDPSTAKAYDENGTELTGEDVLNNPVNEVSWYDALVYCNKRSIDEGFTPCYTIKRATDPDAWGEVPTQSYDIWNAATCDFNANGYRLPTNAEWEWLARGGENYLCAGSDTLDEVAWYTDNTKGTREVKTKAPNGYGLYDMNGNVSEWCWDWYRIISDSTPADGVASGTYRVFRGGGWSSGDSCQVTSSGSQYPQHHYDFYGFRVVRTATEVIDHTHTFATEWTKDETHHWHAATCEHTTEVSEKGEHTYTNGICICGMREMVLIRAGTFKMGSTEGNPNTTPVHEVTITKSFYMGKYEVTQAEYEKYCSYTESKSPSSDYGDGDNYPAYYVSWYDALVYCNKRSMAEGLTPCYSISDSTDPEKWGAVPTESDDPLCDTWDAATCDWNANGYRLPTEAEWEYAARAGDNIVDGLTYSGTSDVNKVGEYAWYSSNSDNATHYVGTKAANAFGLYDMSGNVWEWCWNRYTDSYDTNTEGGNDPTGVSVGSNRVFRGGGWNHDSRYCSVICRGYTNGPYVCGTILGFRVVRTATEVIDHTHTFSTDWTKDETYHWHSATCGHTTEVSEKSEHSFGNWTVTKEATEEAEGTKEQSCTVCGYTATAAIEKLAHTHKFATDWTSDETHHWHKATCEDTDETSGFAEHTFGQYVSNNDATTEKDGTKTRECSVCGYKDTVTDEGSKIIVPEMVFVKGGTVTDPPFTENESVFISGRTVTLSDFYMGKYEVTQEEYASVMEGQKVTVEGKEYALESNPSYCTADSTSYTLFNGDVQEKRPVEGVTWYDSVWYCNALSEKEGLTKAYNIEVTQVKQASGKTGYYIYSANVTLNKDANGYRLPTEAEWEYAARGGDQTKEDWDYMFSGADTAVDVNYDSLINAGLDSVGWYSYNSINGTTGDTSPSSGQQGYGTHQVGKKAHNRLGLYDMSGNVAEWCYDWHGTITTTTPADGAVSGSYRVSPGGSWSYGAWFVSIGYRTNSEPNSHSKSLGFRVVRTAPTE